MAASSLPELLNSGTLLGFLDEYFGLSGEISPISGERDKNYHLLASGGKEFVVKVSPLEEKSVTEFQSQALQHMANNNPELPIPRVVLTLTGDNQALIETREGSKEVLRVLTWLPGNMLGDQQINIQLIRSIAEVQACITNSLAKFKHAEQKHALLWDMEQACTLKSMLTPEVLAKRYEVVAPIIKNFVEYLLPKLGRLRRQVIHNDFNPQNILVDQAKNAVSGILDFGDLINSATIIDLAVALAYMIDVEQADPMGYLEVYVEHYHRVFPLTQEEIQLLYALIRMRLAMVLAISSWRAQKHPERRDYVLRNNLPSWKRLQVLMGIAEEMVTERFLRACGF